MGRKLTKLEKFGLIAAVISGMLFFYLKNVYDPQQVSLQQAQERLNRSIREFNRLQAAEPVFQLRQRYESRQQVLKDLEKQLADMDIRPGLPEDLMSVQRSLYRQMEGHNVRIHKVSPMGTREDLFTWHVFQVQMEGDFAGLISFLREIRTYDQPLHVHKVTVDGEETPWPLKIGMELWIMN